MDRPSASVEVLAGGELIRAAVELNQRNPRFGCPGFSSPYWCIFPEAALAVLDHKFQNQCAVQNASTSLPESLSGLIERVTFFDEDGGFGVLKVKAQGHRDLVTVVGSLPSVSAGEWLTAQGRWVQDREYGQQFRAEMLTSTPPTSKEGIEKYLGSGMVKGIGPVYAKKLVDKFGEGVFDIIEKASARLEDVDGIGPKRRKRIKEAWDEQKIVRDIMLFLHSNGVSTSRAVRIYKTYGEDAIEKVRNDPYRLAKDIHGIGFKTADQIARKIGIPVDSLVRACAGLNHVLLEATGDGHCALPVELLKDEAGKLLLVEEKIVADALERTVASNDLVKETISGQELVFLPHLKRAEEIIAGRIRNLAGSLKRRRERILNAPTHETLPSAERLLEQFDTATAEESEPTENGAESQERIEDQALSLTRPQTEKQRDVELKYLDEIIAQGESILREQAETKFLKLRELVDAAEFEHERLLIFTEHRDTLEHLQHRFEALGYTGQIAAIHGGMDVEERERQRIFFMPPAERRRQNVPNPDAPSARIMLATDAAGEGINLQFAWLMVNFDVPWNPARLEQRMGRLHRFGQRHDEVRIFNFVADKTREGDVLATLLAKLDEARRELCTDKVFDVIGQQLQEVSIRDLLREALFETAPYSAQKQLDSMFATQRLRAAVEEQRRQASSFGDVAKRLGQLNSEIEVERFNQLLPAYVANFVEKCVPRLGFEMEGDLNERARLTRTAGAGWIDSLASHWRDGLAPYVSVRRDGLSANGGAPTAFLRPGEPLFDAFCHETIRRFRNDAVRGGFFLDPEAEHPYFASVYVCQLGERSLTTGNPPRLLERRLVGLRWDGTGEFTPCAPNHLLALVGAPPALVWKAGALLQSPMEQVQRADAHARMMAESTFLQQARMTVRAESATHLEDLQRGFDFSASDLAERRGEFARKVRDGDEQALKQLELVKREQSRVDQEKAEALLYEQRRADMLDIITLDRIAVALVIPDQSPEALESYDKNIEAIAMRVAINFEVDRHKAKVYDVSSPHLARGYDLESHRANSEKIVIEVKGRAGRGQVHLTENEWPTAANVRDKYWLYVVTDCATEPRLYRVQDPVRLAFRTRQSFTLNIGDIIKEAETE